MILHVHIRVSQAVLHWHLTIFKGSSGAGRKYVVRGSSRPRVWSHPHFTGSNLSDFRSTHAIPLRNDFHTGNRGPTRQLRRCHPERCRWKHFSCSRDICITTQILRIQFRENELGKRRLLESVKKLWKETGFVILRAWQEVLGMSTGRRPAGNRVT